MIIYELSAKHWLWESLFDGLIYGTITSLLYFFFFFFCWSSSINFLSAREWWFLAFFLVQNRRHLSEVNNQWGDVTCCFIANTCEPNSIFFPFPVLSFSRLINASYLRLFSLFIYFLLPIFVSLNRCYYSESNCRINLADAIRNCARVHSIKMIDLFVTSFA